MNKKDYYEILGVPKNTTKEDIKKAYKKLAMQYHPDRNNGDHSAEEKFKEIGEAYAVLSDDNKRARYDQFGHEGLSGGGGGFGGFGGFDFNDAESIFEQFFGGSFGGSRQRGRRSGPPPGADLKVNLKLTLEEISEETTKKIKIKKFIKCETCSGSGAKSSTGTKTCPTCNGSGEIKQVQRSLFGQFVNTAPCYACEGSGKIITDKCPDCSGEGRRQGEDTVTVKIPAGVSEGQYLTLQGKGHAGKRGGANGDLLVIIQEEDHKFFHREGQDLFYDLQLSISQAVLGGEIEVPVINGKVKVKIAEGTQPGKRLMLKGKGLPNLNSYGRGDMIVRITVWIPTKITKESRKVFEDLEKIDEVKPQTSDKGFFNKIKDFFNDFSS